MPSAQHGALRMTEHRIESRIDINAPPSRVWAVLTDFAAMPGWNPFIRSISGEAKQDARLSVLIAPPGKSGKRFRIGKRRFISCARSNYRKMRATSGAHSCS